MRTHWLHWTAWVGLVAGLAGCNRAANVADSKPQTPSGSAAAAPQPAPASVPVATSPAKVENEPLAPVPESVANTPQAVVTEFLKSLRAGDKQMAAALLTTKAREETAKHNMAVQPPGTPNATYQVGDVEFPNERKDAAYVNSVWKETFEDNQSESYEIVWVLRRQSDGWRVAGMATKLPAEDVPLFLNFEDPEDMLRKWQAAEQEVAQKQSGSSTGGGPGATGDGSLKR